MRFFFFLFNSALASKVQEKEVDGHIVKEDENLFPDIPREGAIEFFAHLFYSQGMTRTFCKIMA